MHGEILLTVPGKLSLLMVLYGGNSTGGNSANFFLPMFLFLVFIDIEKFYLWLPIYFMTQVLFLKWGK